MSSTDICIRLTNAIHSFEIGRPIWPQLRMLVSVYTIHGLVVGGTPVTFHSVAGGAWNVQTLDGKHIFLVLPDEVEVLPDDT